MGFTPAAPQQIKAPFWSPKRSVLSPFFLDSSRWEQKPAEKLHFFSLLFFVFSLVFICRFYFFSLFL
jgi:hypothetical protein